MSPPNDDPVANSSHEQEEPLLRTPTRHYESFLANPHGVKKSRNRNNNNVASRSWSEYLNTKITTRYTDLVLIFCFGTGNTIFAALGVSNLPAQQPKYAWAKSLTSILAYLLGALVFSNFHRFVGERKRWAFAFSFLVQAAVTLIAAILVGNRSVSGSPVSLSFSTSTIPEDPGFPWTDLIPISLLAFQASGKVAASRILGWNGLPTVVLTSLYSDFMGDPGLLAGPFANATRNRRLAAIIFYLGGAVAAGPLVKSGPGFSGLLYVAVGMKFGVVLSWILWPEEKEEQGDEEGN
ncbi:hypothetical protein LTR78_004224 [Recurvomyces mirabilis]|uniref:DUF1275 domain protein n=1 Tax=Recurvomyces mirabilis TaxID=574656 RepID=A0AAE1C332_9PEZI|nr:hypothetical protein LTR78_004224 [Recurvomyces mirabilis]KAK5153606.1 hypothetical protein LTS14_007300 [Recurvomyces mirabilis]